MTCIVRKTLSDIGEVEPIPYTVTSFGKLVFDEAQYMLNYIKVEHARFLLRDSESKNALLLMYKAHKNRNYNLRVNEVLSNEIDIINATIDKFNNELPTQLTILSRSGNKINISIIDIPSISHSDNLNHVICYINETLKAINSINLRSICTPCDNIKKLQLAPTIELEHLDDIKLSNITMDDVTHAYNIGLSNFKSLVLLESYIADVVSKVHTAHACLLKYIKQLEASN